MFVQDVREKYVLQRGHTGAKPTHRKIAYITSQQEMQTEIKRPTIHILE